MVSIHRYGSIKGVYGYCTVAHLKIIEQLLTISYQNWNIAFQQSLIRVILIQHEKWYTSRPVGATSSLCRQNYTYKQSSPVLMFG